MYDTAGNIVTQRYYNSLNDGIYSLEEFDLGLWNFAGSDINPYSDNAFTPYKENGNIGDFLQIKGHQEFLTSLGYGGFPIVYLLPIHPAVFKTVRYPADGAPSFDDCPPSTADFIRIDEFYNFQAYLKTESEYIYHELVDGNEVTYQIHHQDVWVNTASSHPRFYDNDWMILSQQNIQDVEYILSMIRPAEEYVYTTYTNATSPYMTYNVIVSGNTPENYTIKLDVVTYTLGDNYTDDLLYTVKSGGQLTG